MFCEPTEIIGVQPERDPTEGLLSVRFGGFDVCRHSGRIGKVRARCVSVACPLERAMFTPVEVVRALLPESICPRAERRFTRAIRTHHEGPGQGHDPQPGPCLA